MPVSVTSIITGPYAPNGVTTAFPFDFKADSASEVKVVDQDGIEVSAGLYSVALNTGEGGEVTFSTAPSAADYAAIYIVGDPSLTQTSDFGNAGPSFNPAALTRAFDRAALRDLKQQSEIDRSPKVPFGEDGFEVPALAARTGKFMAFSAVDGAPIASEGTDANSILKEDIASTDPGKGAALIGTARSITLEQALELIDGKVIYPELLGMVADGGDATAATNAGALAAIRAAAEAIGNGCKVMFAPGVYTLPEQQEMAADDTEWIFAKGAILKLHSTQVVNEDFLIWTSPVGQIVRNLQVDGNRAAQDETTFGADRCAAIVISPDDCLFDGVHVVSSPGKGFGVVSAAGETSRDTHVRNVTGSNCKTQVCIFDANNGTGFFSNCTIDGVNIGETSHAGLAINDGVTDCEIRNVYCNVGAASVWDAVSVRDSSRLKMTNITGVGGNNGVRFQKLNIECADIELLNILGEGASQSGVMFLAAKRIRGANVVGRNNGVAGVNLARITSGDQRCEDIHLTGVTGIDTQATPAQQYGILMGGTRRCSVDAGWTASGNTTADASLITGVNEDSWIEWEQEYTAEISSVAANATVGLDIPLDAPFVREYLAVRVPLIINSNTSTLALAPTGQEVAFLPTIYQTKVRNQSGTTAHTGTARITIGSKR